jgi:hypothetical protein
MREWHPRMSEWRSARSQSWQEESRRALQWIWVPKVEEPGRPEDEEEEDSKVLLRRDTLRSSFPRSYKSVVKPAVEGSLLHVTAYKSVIHLPCTGGQPDAFKNRTRGARRLPYMTAMQGYNNWRENSNLFWLGMFG